MSFSEQSAPSTFFFVCRLFNFDFTLTLSTVLLLTKKSFSAPFREDGFDMFDPREINLTILSGTLKKSLKFSFASVYRKKVFGGLR